MMELLKKKHEDATRAWKTLRDDSKLKRSLILAQRTGGVHG